MDRTRFAVENVGPIGNVDVQFGDLTVLVGPQATGKSLFLQLFKYAEDSCYIRSTMDKYGLSKTRNVQDLLDLYLGSGMGDIWRKNTSEIRKNGEQYQFPPSQSKSDLGDPCSEKVYYVPAQRVLIFRDGWPQPFSGYSIKDPFVLKNFSERIRLFLDAPESKDNEPIFPTKRRLKGPILKALDRTIFHGATIAQDRKSMKRELLLSPKGARDISLTAWSTGQREFTPLLLGFYELMPRGKKPTLSEINWVILEEIEAGLHPKAIFSVMAAIMQLLERQYRVILSTHSVHVLDIVWAIRRIRSLRLATAQKVTFLSELLDIPSSPNTIVGKLLKAILEKSFMTYYFDSPAPGKPVISTDISTLDPGDDDIAVAGWGGLSGYSGKASDIVARAVQEERYR